MAEVAPKRMMTRAEVASLLGVTQRTLCSWEHAGTGPEVVRFSPKVARYPADAVERFARAQGAR